jgi:hypothetical protein
MNEGEKGGGAISQPYTLFNIIYIMRTLGFTSGVVVRSF